MRIVVVVPTWMVGDGQYGDVAVGLVSEFGFALEATSVETCTQPDALKQNASVPPVTTAAGIVRRPSLNAPPVLDAGTIRPILWSARSLGDGQPVVAQGRLVVEPHLWATDGVLWPLNPDGVLVWSVLRIRCSADRTVDLRALPAATTVDHSATYVLDLTRP